MGAGGRAVSQASFLRLAQVRRLERFFTAILVGTLQVEPLGQAVFNLVGIAYDVTKIKANDCRKIVDAVGVAINQVRFDRMFHFSAGQRVVEYFAQGWRAEFHIGLYGAAIHDILDGQAHASRRNSLFRVSGIL